MALSESQRRACDKWNKEKSPSRYDRTTILFPKGKLAIAQAHAKYIGESTNSFFMRAIDETMVRDITEKKKKTPAPSNN